MITLTKEWLLKTIAELEEERDAVPGVVNEDATMALAAMKLALASLEAESKPRQPELSHVIYHFRDWNEGFPIERFKADYVISWMLANYPPAQPAAVSVPDDVSGPLAHAYKELTPTFMRNHIDVFERYGIYPDGSAGIQAMRIALDGMNRRAAMLQGAENAESPTTMQTAPALDSSPKIAESPTGINQGKSEPVTTANKLSFEQWLSQQTGTIDVECGCVMTEVFFHWLRVAYEAGNSPHCREILNSSTNNCREISETSTNEHEIETHTLLKSIEGMEVSVDVSTCDTDAGHRYFGTVTEISELDTAKNGYILLVQDAKPNFKQAGNSPVAPDGWKVEAERLAEVHGCSFVVFRHGEEPQCADSTKIIISFTDEGLGHHSAAPQQEVKRG